MATRLYYRTRDGRFDFGFDFIPHNGRINIKCFRHPPLGRRDASAHKTHLFSSGLLCFTSGREPKTPERAKQLAKQWAEYYLNYIRTGETAA